ncbi:restriction endonuclease subunit S [Psychrobacter sp. Sarcosine-3u-12]|uniref:restriction endonuclease subunit S n=1 Tax=Psychrobacter sp. Sarcosine-3u-12 TaxID=2058325 RepID=UPI000C3330E4|nr:restriction endonuclease subunit S [Psychrobacter sp. Sarcosine-3u-12]PKG36814.1 hypothetical protein CXF65_00390 [Psychrobacter sp. Sarcosine-3u-12]
MVSEDQYTSTIGELIESGVIVAHKDGNHGSNYPRSNEFGDEGVPFLTAKLVSDSGRIDFDNAPRLNLEKANKIKFGYVEEGDVLLSHNATVGRVALVPELREKVLIGTSLTHYRLDSLRLLPKYLAAYFRGRDFQNQLSSMMGGMSTRNQVPITAQRLLTVVIPPLEEQKAIAHILGSLDDKIELNRQMNETLETMAQALFKSWFVDFDPVIDNAITAGNAIPDEFAERAEQRKAIEKKDHSDIQDLFPDEFEFTEEMGWIPKGWEVKCFGDLLDSTIGGDWGKPDQDEKHTRESVIIRGTDIPKLKIGERSEAPKRWVEEKKLKTRILRPFDIVIEISGGSPTQSTGRSIIITEQILERLGGVAEPASFCRKFSPSNKFLGLYAGIHLQKIYDDGKMWEYQNQSTGIANFQTTSFLEREQLVVPSESVVLKFYDTLEPIISKMSSNQQIELARLRDTLLPKLMSGELRISDAVALVDEAV